jgi:hypothetical protein
MELRRSRHASRGGFTFVGLIATVCTLALLCILLAPPWIGSKRSSEALRCINNLRQLGVAMQLYTDQHDDVFPPHRNNGTSNSGVIPTNWWGTTILRYAGNDTNLFRCPALKGRRTDRGVKWEWRFDVNLMGYGYNAFFLGAHPYRDLSLSVGGVQFSSPPAFQRGSIVRPQDNLLLADSMPTPSLLWGSVLWWPSGCMNTTRSTVRSWEGVETLRHARTGVAAFNDGHVELRRDERINPSYDPYSGNPKSLTNANYWDPLQRAR